MSGWTVKRGKSETGVKREAKTENVRISHIDNVKKVTCIFHLPPRCISSSAHFSRLRYTTCG